MITMDLCSILLLDFKFTQEQITKLVHCYIREISSYLWADRRWNYDIGRDSTINIIGHEQ